MAEDRGSLFERWQYYQMLHANGAWDHVFRLPTREDYRRWLLVNTESAVARAEPTLQDQRTQQAQEPHAVDLGTAEALGHTSGQQQLAQLQDRLEALLQPTQTQEQHHKHRMRTNG